MNLLRLNALIVAAGMVLTCHAVDAELQAEKAGVMQLPAKPSPHWVWINDVVFDYMEAGKAYLVDGDSGRFLGLLSTGFNSMVLALPEDYSRIYSPETYLSRGTRGDRTDIVVVYDPRSLSPVDEIPIPAKRAESNPTLGHFRLTDDDRFLLTYNFTPAQSITVVDAEARKFVGEIEIAGCALAYPIGRRAFFSICGDGSLLTVTLDDAGREKSKTRSKPLFDPNGNFVSERPVRYGDSYLFFSVDGRVLPVDFASGAPVFQEAWSLLDQQAERESWRTGGLQNAAVHAASGRLYLLMHIGDESTRKNPGGEVWVYDIAERKRVRRIKLEDLATSIQVSQDPQPLLFSIFVETRTLDVYDARSGELQRRIENIGYTPTMMQTPALQ